MKNKIAAAARAVLSALLLVAMLSSCASGKDGFGPGGKPALLNPEFDRTPPPLLLAEYVGTQQAGPKEDGGRTGLIDMTNVSKGYIAAKCTAPVDAKVGIEINGDRDLYSLSNDGTFNFFPITRGDGNYIFTLYLQVEGSSYEQFLVADASVALESPLAPYLVPSKIVDYNATSESVAQSYEIAKHCSSDLEVVQQVYSWIAENITYDTEKAAKLATSNTDYIPSPDATLREKQGICYDYASLAAAMLRANGIPTVLVKGDVKDPDQNQIYHAWNMVWLEEKGWISVDLAVNPNDWTRIDTTFAAAGPDMGKFIGDGSNYTPLSEH